MASGESGINSAKMTIINPRKEYWQSRGSNQRPLFPSPKRYRLSYGARLKVVNQFNPLSNTPFLRPFQIQRSCRRQLKCGYYRILRYRLHRKHCGKKVKLLILSNFSFSRNVFLNHFLQCVKMSIF